MKRRLDKKLLDQAEKKLKKEKAILEKELSQFAKKNESLENDWKTRFPHFDSEAGSSLLEKASDEVEEYGTLLSLESNLELRLRDIQNALLKIKKGRFGICEKCGKMISKKRLKLYPEAKFCQKCLGK
jgi:RNA polymerase-binding transcription factor DksA